MPSPKYGTVTTAVARTVERLRKGEVQFRNDKGGTVSVGIGRKSFSDDALTQNVTAFLKALMQLRPKGVAGSGTAGYIERVTVSTTQGKGYPLSGAAVQSVTR